MTAQQFWMAVHRYLGLACLAFLTIAAVTGCILCFRAPLDAMLNRDLYGRPGAPIDAIAAVARYQAASPTVQVLSFPLRIAEGGNLPVTVTPPAGSPGFDQVFLDRDGRAVGGRRTRPGWDRRHLLQGVYEFHYTLLGGTWGRWLMGLAAAGWLIGAVVGLYLTLPSRRPFWRNWGRSWTVRLKNRLPRLLLDLHQASGLWLLIPVVVLAWTSVSMNFFDEAFVPVSQALSPARPSPFDPGARRSDTAPGAPLAFGRAVSLATARAQARGLAWRPAQVWVRPDLGLYGVAFTDDGMMNFRRLGPIAYVFDRTGRFVYEDNPYEDSAGRAISRSLYPLHTGKVAGLGGQALDFLLGLITVEQSLTGIYLWWKRRGPRIAAKRASRMSAA
jgi:uncharacterized iron-regulated membrane protein